MHRRSWLLTTFLLLALALPLSASQFVRLPFDQVAREATYIVRGTIGQTWSAWDDEHQVIFTYATIRVNRYFGEITGPDTLVVREVGGTVGDYTQEAIGFPMIRAGEDTVLFLAKWDDSNDYRIHAYNQGKYLVRQRGAVEVLVEDPVKQGDARLEGPDRFHMQTNSQFGNLHEVTLDEFATMVEAARAAMPYERPRQR